MPVLPFCDPESVSVVFGGITSAAMLCDIGLTASVLAVAVDPKRRACCQEAQGIPVFRWFLAYAVVIGGSLSSGRMTPLRTPKFAFYFGDVLVVLGFAIAVSASIKMSKNRQHWAPSSYFQTLGLVTLFFFLGCFMVSHATHGWSADCDIHNDLVVPCFPETFFIAACAGIAACMMGAVVGIVFFVAADEFSLNNSSLDFLMLVSALVVVAITLAGFEYSTAKVYGGGVSDGSGAQDVSSLGMVGTFFQCAGLIGGGSYATAGVMASSAAVELRSRASDSNNHDRRASDGTDRNVELRPSPQGGGLEEQNGPGAMGEGSGQQRDGMGSASTRGGQHRTGFGCSLVNCIGRVAVAASAWCAGGVVVLTASQKGPACTSAENSVGNQSEFIKVKGSDGLSVEVHVLRHATVETGQQVALSRPWAKQAILAFSQVWAPAVICLILLGSAGQALTVAACREFPGSAGSLVGPPFQTEIELAVAENWQRAEPVEGTQDRHA